MRALVSGATGYIGSHLVADWMQRGDEVHAIVRKQSDTNRLSPSIGQDRIHLYDGSLDSLSQAVADSKPEVVLHLASLFVVQHAHEQVSTLIESNILFATMLLEA